MRIWRYTSKVRGRRDALASFGSPAEARSFEQPTAARFSRQRWGRSRRFVPGTNGKRGAIFLRRLWCGCRTDRGWGRRRDIEWSEGPSGVCLCLCFFRTAPQRVTRIALDEGSRTSAALAQVLLAERFGVRPAVEPLPIGSGVDATDADAVLLIGDRAIGPNGGPADSHPAAQPRKNGSFQLVWDLGDEWCRWTGLPFVFAAWAARPGVNTEALEPLLTAARDRGVANLAAIAAAEAPRHGLTVPQCLSYFRDNLHYRIGSAEREAMHRFRELVGAIGLLSTGQPQSVQRPSRPHAGARMETQE